MTPYERNDLAENTKENKFTTILDDTTDIDTTMSCGILVKLYESEKIQNRLLALENKYTYQ